MLLVVGGREIAPYEHTYTHTHKHTHAFTHTNTHMRTHTRAHTLTPQLQVHLGQIVSDLPFLRRVFCWCEFSST